MLTNSARNLYVFWTWNQNRSASKEICFLKIQTCQKLITRKVLCFSHSKVLKLGSINSWMVSINSWTALDVSKLDLSLDPLSFWESRINNQVLSIELWETVNLHLTSTVEKSCQSVWGGDVMWQSFGSINSLAGRLGTRCNVENFLKTMAKSFCYSLCKLQYQLLSFSHIFNQVLEQGKWLMINVGVKTWVLIN